MCHAFVSDQPTYFQVIEELTDSGDKSYAELIKVLTNYSSPKPPERGWGISGTGTGMGKGIFRVKSGQEWGQGWFLDGSWDQTRTTERAQRNTLAVGL